MDRTKAIRAAVRVCLTSREFSRVRWRLHRLGQEKYDSPRLRGIDVHETRLKASFGD